MSGSKDKLRRRAQKEQGLDMRNMKEVEAEESRRKLTRTAVIVLAAVAVIAIAAFALNSVFFHRNVTAFETQGTSFTITDMSYFYSVAFQDLRERQANIQVPDPAMMAHIDTGVEITPEQVEQRGLEIARTQAYLNRRAREEGLTLTDELRREVSNAIQEIEQTYMWHGFRSPAAYLTSVFGRGMTMDILRGRLEFDALGRAYADTIQAEIKAGYTEEQLEAYYLEHFTEDEQIVYRSYTIFFAPGDPESEAEAHATAATLEAAAREGAAEFMDAIRAEVQDIEHLAEMYEDDDSTIQRQAADALPDMEHIPYRDWLLEPARQAGDVTVVEEEEMGTIHVLYFVERDERRYFTANVRHVLIRPEEFDMPMILNEEGEEVTDWAQNTILQEEADAVARARAEELLAQWEAGEATEATFIDMVIAYSADFDAETADEYAEPGLFEDINRQSNFVPQFLAWAVDTDRQAGDVGVVDTQFGSHIMFFVGHNDEMYRRYTMAEESLLEEDYEAWLESILPTISYQTRFTLRFAR